MTSRFELVALLGLFVLMILVGARLAATRRAPERFALHVDANRLDFGRAWAARSFRWDLPITNASDSQDVAIIDFRTSCQCTSVAPVPLIIPARTTRNLELTMDLASDRQGGGDADGEPFSVTLHPILNQLGGPIPVWRVTGRVRRLFANVDGLVTIDEDLVYDPVSVLRASLPLTTRLPVRTLDVSCRKQFLQASVRADPHTPNRYLVDLAFRRGLAPGEYDFDLLFGGVLANGESIRRAPLRVACRIVEDIQVLPSQLLLGLLNPDEERSDTVVIRSRRGEPFELVEARADSDDVCVRPRPRRPRQVAELSLAVTVRSASPGFHRQTVAAAIRRLDQPTSKIVRLEVLYTIAEEPVVP